MGYFHKFKESFRNAIIRSIVVKRLSEYFKLTQKEQRGVLVLICVLLLLILSNIILPIFYPKHAISYQLKDYDIVLDSIEHSLTYQEFDPPQEIKDRKLFPFNPNTLVKSGWIKLGLSEKQIQTIINYRNKGGKFYKKSDIRKLYSLSEKEANELIPYVDLPEEVNATASILKNPKEFKKTDSISKSIYKVKSPKIFEVNAADTLDFMQLKGIGPVLARRIIKYRDVLGGFISLEQIKDVYGLTIATYEEMLPWLEVDATKVRKLAINSITADELRKHPYFRDRNVWGIIRYREQHGAFKGISDLGKIHSLDEDFLRKIEFYLDFK